MNKELTPLEALERLEVTFNSLIESNEFVNRDISIIETALKDYEKKTKLAKEYADVNNVAKRLKALEIIKEKQVNIKELKKCDSVGKYNYRIYKEEEKLTQEEYDILKEVLL